MKKIELTMDEIDEILEKLARLAMKATKKPSYNVVPFANRYNNISPNDLECILETLEDMGYLSDKGIEFRNAFWRLFIKE